MFDLLSAKKYYINNDLVIDQHRNIYCNNYTADIVFATETVAVGRSNILLNAAEIVNQPAYIKNYRGGESLAGVIKWDESELTWVAGFDGESKQIMTMVTSISNSDNTAIAYIASDGLIACTSVADICVVDNNGIFAHKIIVSPALPPSSATPKLIIVGNSFTADKITITHGTGSTDGLYATKMNFETINNLSLTISSDAGLTIKQAKTLTISTNIELSGTDSTTYAMDNFLLNTGSISITNFSAVNGSVLSTLISGKTTGLPLTTSNLVFSSTPTIVNPVLSGLTVTGSLTFSNKVNKVFVNPSVVDPVFVDCGAPPFVGGGTFEIVNGAIFTCSSNLAINSDIDENHPITTTMHILNLDNVARLDRSIAQFGLTSSYELYQLISRSTGIGNDFSGRLVFSDGAYFKTLNLFDHNTAVSNINDIYFTSDPECTVTLPSGGYFRIMNTMTICNDYNAYDDNPDTLYNLDNVPLYPVQWDVANVLPPCIGFIYEGRLRTDANFNYTEFTISPHGPYDDTDSYVYHILNVVNIVINSDFSVTLGGHPNQFTLTNIGNSIDDQDAITKNDLVKSTLPLRHGTTTFSDQIHPYLTDAINRTNNGNIIFGAVGSADNIAPGAYSSVQIGIKNTPDGTYLPMTYLTAGTSGSANSAPARYTWVSIIYSTLIGVIGNIKVSGTFYIDSFCGMVAIQLCRGDSSDGSDGATASTYVTTMDTIDCYSPVSGIFNFEVWFYNTPFLDSISQVTAEQLIQIRFKAIDKNPLSTGYTVGLVGGLQLDTF